MLYVLAVLVPFGANVFVAYQAGKLYFKVEEIKRAIKLEETQRAAEVHRAAKLREVHRAAKLRETHSKDARAVLHEPQLAAQRFIWNMSYSEVEDMAQKLVGASKNE